VVRVNGPEAAGLSDPVADLGIDCSGYDRATFFVAWGAIVAGGVQSIDVFQSDDDGVVDSYSGLVGNVDVADDDDNKITMLEIYRPLKRWLKVRAVRATQNATIELMWCILSDPSVSGAALSSTISGYEEHVSPVEGTA
jgi:hypothetical protein